MRIKILIYIKLKNTNIYQVNPVKISIMNLIKILYLWVNQFIIFVHKLGIKEGVA